MVTPTGWGLLNLGINTVMIGRILNDRREVEFSAEELDVYEVSVCVLGRGGGREVEFSAEKLDVYEVSVYVCVCARVCVWCWVWCGVK